MTTPLPKRRRLDETHAQSVLKKPFRSPFKTPAKNGAVAAGTDTLQDKTPGSAMVQMTPLRQSMTAHATETGSATPYPPVETNADEDADADAGTTSPSVPRRRVLPVPAATKTLGTTLPSRNPAKTGKPGAHPHPLLSAEIAHQRHLQRSITALRSSNDTLSQAVALARSTRDEELQALVEKWRSASRAAAEEVFGGTRERVNGMGGVGAWRDREKRQREFREGWGEEEQKVESESDEDEDEEEEEGLSAEEREGRKVARDRRREGRAEARREREWRAQEWEEEKKKLEGERPKVEDEGRDDDSFTMDMMLKTLNIELDVIGWSKTQQRWVG